MNAREQIGKHNGCCVVKPAYRKYLKRLTVKAERREAKKLEDAKPPHYKGYAT